MQIKTITCHDVYNVGASLQAYALSKYLTNCGHKVEIIDYKPDYLSYHYSLSWVGTKKYNKPIIKQAYLLAKLPKRLIALASKRKRNFDLFKKNYLPVTKISYRNIAELNENCPHADLYIAGSDQIWNPFFDNGKDPSFFLQFVPKEKKKISYAASFAVDSMTLEDQERIKPWLKQIDQISVREKTGLDLLNSMGFTGVNVCDPVFLLNKEDWEDIAKPFNEFRYVFVYDFDNNGQIAEIVKRLKKDRDLKIVSFFDNEYADRVCSDMGPLEFVGAIKSADVVVSNSFHATVFSIIFNREFYVVKRQEQINSRMEDLLRLAGTSEHLISTYDEILENNMRTDFDNESILNMIEKSKEFLLSHISKE
ncbi:MAG: polysaccharide pyruvyl transferase family protein [Ruminococcus sp.]|nr:polysaccharide pyruvyl transferase family protein [Ruminococcus sp.]